MPGKTFAAAHNHARLSPYKARPVIDLVRGKGVNEALSILEYEPRRAAPMVRRVIQSALANASNDLEVKLNHLVVSEARVDGGPLLRGAKRFMPRAMGRAFPIRKRTCHIRVTLTEVAPKEPSKKAAGKGKGKAKGAPPEAAAKPAAGTKE
jgi:large subunit ribosomal protein L22